MTFSKTFPKLFCALLVVAFLFGLCSCEKSGGSNTSSVSSASNVLNLHKETQHFEFLYTKQDLTSLPDLENALESNYEKILKDLNTKLSFKVIVQIYPTLKDFDNAIKEANAPSWVAGKSDNRHILMVSPSHDPCHDYQGMIKCAVHEFTHVATDSLNDDLYSVPRWVREGLAYLEADQITDSDKSEVALIVRSGKIPTLDDLSDNNKFDDINGFQLAPTAVQFIIKKYGWDKLIAYIKSPLFMETIFNASPQDLQNQWYAYLKSNCANK